jgi:hypothetical protein
LKSPFVSRHNWPKLESPILLELTAYRRKLTAST